LINFTGFWSIIDFLINFTVFGRFWSLLASESDLQKWICPETAQLARIKKVHLRNLGGDLGKSIIESEIAFLEVEIVEKRLLINLAVFDRFLINFTDFSRFLIKKQLFDQF